MTGTLNTWGGEGVTPVMDGDDFQSMSCEFQPEAISLPKGTVVGQITANTLQNEIQTFTASGTISGGTFQLAWISGQQTLITIPMVFNVANAVMQVNLDTIFGAGNTLVGAGPAPATFTVTFQGRCAGLTLPLGQVFSALTGTNPLFTPSRTQTGNPGRRYWRQYLSGNGDGTQVAKGILQYAIATDVFGNLQVGGGEFGEGSRSAPVVVVGTFRTSDLVGIDATSVASLGRLLSGTTSLLSDSATILRMQ